MKTIYEFLFAPKTKAQKISVAAIWLFVGFFTLYEVYNCLKLELSLPSTMDSQLFMTVGRGITQGLRPYVDMYENKPPAIFWLSALSYLITGDVYLNHLVSLACTFCTGLIPVTACLWILKKHPTDRVKKYALIASSVCFGLLMWFFCAFRAGRGQVESFGAFFISLYLLIVFMCDSSRLKAYSWQVFAAAAAVMTGVMFKEPFVLVSIAGALILCHTKKDFVYKLLLPLVYGGALGVVLMAVTGILPGYLNVYLSHMLGTHVSVYGPVWVRGFNFIFPMLSTVMFGGIFEAVILLLFFFFVISKVIAQNHKCCGGKLAIAFNIIKTAVSLYLFCLAIGMGGQYYRHHFAFGAPFYIALGMYFFNTMCIPFKSERPEINTAKLRLNLKRLLSLFLVLCMSSLITVCFTADFSDNNNEMWLNVRNISKKQAQYVDSVLEVSGAESYQYLGFAGPIFFFSYTEKLPLGPVFVQDEYNFQTEGWFTENLLNQLKNADVIIYSENNTGVISSDVDNILKTQFTTNAPAGVADIELPSYFPYTIYYRVSESIG